MARKPREADDITFNGAKMKSGSLRNGVSNVGTVNYTVSEIEEDASAWSVGRHYTSDDDHTKIALAAEDLFLRIVQ